MKKVILIIMTLIMTNANSQHYHGIGSDYIYKVKIDDSLESVVSMHYSKNSLGMSYRRYKEYILRKNPELAKRARVYTGMRVLIPSQKEVEMGTRRNIYKVNNYKPRVAKRYIAPRAVSRSRQLASVDKNIHIVKKRETLSVIVYKYYKTDFEYWTKRFKQENNLRSSVGLRVGMKLKIPRGKRALSSYEAPPVFETEKTRPNKTEEAFDREKELREIWVDDVDSIDVMG